MFEPRLLIIDDDPGICETLSDVLQEKGFCVNTVNTGREALDREAHMAFDAALIDIRLPDMEGITLLRELSKRYPETACIIITGHASVKNAIDALKDGAKGYFVKPLVIEEVTQRVFEILDKQRLQREHDQAIKSLKTSEARYYDLYNNAPDMFISIDAKTAKIIQCNRTFLKSTGYIKKEMIRRSVFDLYHPDCIEDAKKTFKLFLATGAVQNKELQLKRRDGSRLEVSLNASAVRDEQGNILYSRSILRDITERKQIEKALRQRNQTQNILNNVLKTSIRPHNLNEILESMLEQIIRTPWIKLLSGAITCIEGCPDVLVIKSHYKLPQDVLTTCHHIPFGKCICGRAAATKEIQFASSLDDCHEIRCEHTQPHKHYCVPIMSSGKVMGVLNLYLKKDHPRSKEEELYLLTVADILAGVIERKRAEDALRKARDELEIRVAERTAELKAVHGQLLHAEKLTALGKLAASVAHEFNNPIFGIKMVLEELRQNEKMNIGQKKLIEMAIKESHRITGLIKNLQDFYRPSSGTANFIDIHHAIEEILIFCRNKLKLSNVKIITDFAKGMPSIVVVPDQMKQVFLNIITNAEEAMYPSGGELIIRTRLCENNVRIVFQDNGRGIPKENLEKIFDPFFTTKGKVKGTGLGLSVSHGIIKSHGGNLSVESIPGQGSTFTIELPLEPKKS